MHCNRLLNLTLKKKKLELCIFSLILAHGLPKKKKKKEI